MSHELNGLRLFSVKEANQMLPKVRDFIHRVHDGIYEIEKMEVEIDALEIIAECENKDVVPSRLADNIGEYNEKVQTLNTLLDEFNRTGCLLKDVRLGLVDFPSLREGKIIYLCWKLGEPEVLYWHDLNSGYASRQTIIFDEPMSGGEASSG